jgi:hypothetical protein
VDQGEWLTGWQPATGQGTSGCTEVELNLSSIAAATNVQFRFLSGSSVANGAAFDDIALVSGAIDHGCCDLGSAGCTDAVIEACTCALDSYCCETAWDDACVVVATAACNADCAGVPACGAADAGSCFLGHQTPFCADSACCGAVCSVDPFCCESAWDELCAIEASAICQGSDCGGALPSCFQASLSPGCGDPACCALVCVVDPVCCVTAWDAICVAQAGAACEQPIDADINGDGRVDGADLAAVLAGWGTAGTSDIDGSGQTDGADLAALLAAWTG